MSSDKKHDNFKDAPDMSGAWRVIGATVGAFVTLLGMGAAMKKSHDRKQDKKDDNSPSP